MNYFVLFPFSRALVHLLIADRPRYRYWHIVNPMLLLPRCWSIAIVHVRIPKVSSTALAWLIISQMFCCGTRNLLIKEAFISQGDSIQANLIGYTAREERGNIIIIESIEGFMFIVGVRQIVD